MAKSIRRIEEAARAANLEIQVEQMPGSTRTATQAGSQGLRLPCWSNHKIDDFEACQSRCLTLLLLGGNHKINLNQPRHYLVRDWKKPMRNGCVPIRDLPLVACLRLVTNPY